MRKSKTIQVQGTNDNSVVSKLSAASSGYYNDAFLKYFCSKTQKRTSLINRGYYIRFKAIEAVFESWIDLLHNLALQKYQVISLGAGFDTSYFRLKQEKKLPKGCKYIEVDFPEVMKRKFISINEHEGLMKLLTKDEAESCASNIPEIILFTHDYILLGLDMAENEKLQALSIDIKLDFSLPTLFLSECAITYMDVQRSNQLISWAKENFPNSAFVTYEQVYPEDGFGLVMQNHFRILGSPLKSIKKYPDLKSQRLRFLNLGWFTCSVKRIDSFWTSLSQEEKSRIFDLELFDEYETWHEKCSHYVLIWACQGIITSVPIFAETDSVPDVKSSNIEELVIQKASVQMHRYGHQAVMFMGNMFLITGGFGCFKERHQRLKGLTCGNLRTGSACEVELEDLQNALGARMHHSMVMLKDNRIVIYGGRSAPNKPYGGIVLLHPKESVSFHNSNATFHLDCDTQAAKVKLSYTCSVVEEGGDIPEHKWRHTSNVVMLNDMENIFVFGGCTMKDRATNDCHILNTDTWMWSKVPKQERTPIPRHSHSCVVDGNQIFISGGLTEEERILNTVHVFTVSTWSWDLLNVKGLLPRYSHTSHVFQGKLFLVGGVSSISGIYSHIAYIDLTTLSASEILTFRQDPEYPILLHNHTSLLYEGQIIIIGGGGNCFSFGTHFNEHLLSINLTKL